MNTEVDVSKQDGKTLADAPRASAPAQPLAHAAQDDVANENVRRVIAANMGKDSGVASRIAQPQAAQAH